VFVFTTARSRPCGTGVGLASPTFLLPIRKHHRRRRVPAAKNLLAQYGVEQIGNTSVGSGERSEIHQKQDTTCPELKVRFVISVGFGLYQNATFDTSGSGDPDVDLVWFGRGIFKRLLEQRRWRLFVCWWTTRSTFAREMWCALAIWRRLCPWLQGTIVDLCKPESNWATLLPTQSRVGSGRSCGGRHTVPHRCINAGTQQGKNLFEVRFKFRGSWLDQSALARAQGCNSFLEVSARKPLCAKHISDPTARLTRATLTPSNCTYIT
jgi:hypothetical protein